jgi:predicted NBD/HSP70 family sugar kinase
VVPNLPANARLVLGALRHGASSITDLQRRTHLSQLTIRKHLETLAVSGLVVRSGLGPSNGGRQPRLYVLVPDSRVVLAVHLRFPGASVALVGLDGRVLSVRHIPADGRADPSMVLERVAHEADALYRRTGTSARVVGVGVALPGYADLSRGVSLRIGRAPAWHDVPVAEILGRRLGLPVVLIHDTAAMALAEHEVGEAQAEQHFAFVLAEEGVSAGLFLQGAIYQGTFGNAGLIGHMTIRPEGRPCYCGNTGCVESYASLSALSERAAELVTGDGPRPTAGTVIGLALNGQEPYRTVLVDALKSLGVAIANLAKVLEVHTVFVGGYPAGLPDGMRAHVVDVTRAHLQPPLRTHFTVRYSRVHEAALVGAAVPVIRQFLGVTVSA